MRNAIQNPCHRSDGGELKRLGEKEHSNSQLIWALERTHFLFGENRKGGADLPIDDVGGKAAEPRMWGKRRLLNLLQPSKVR